jgi:hypothetical protein
MRQTTPNLDCRKIKNQKAPLAPFLRDHRRSSDDLITQTRHVDVRYNNGIDKEGNDIRDYIDLIMLKGERESRAANRKIAWQTGAVYSVGVPNLTRTFNQRQRRKRAAQMR